MYSNNIEQLSLALSKQKRKRNIITTAKLITAAVVIYLIYLSVAQSPEVLWWLVATGAIFIILSIIDTKIVERCDMLRALIKCNQTEIDYAEGLLENLPDGKELIDALHPYASDLDIFGESSIYQAINRTVTPGGRELLINSLLYPTLDHKEIATRKAEAANLATDISWCIEFRATGIVYPTDNDETIKQWQQQKTVINPKVKIPLYAINAITISAIVASAFSIINPTIAVALFFVQMGVALSFTKRINSVQARLDKFIKATANYLFLIKLIKVSEHLAEIKSQLFSQGDVVKALRALDQIGGVFDSRANIVSLFLQGVYMRDIHTLLSLEKWKNEHLSNIDRWKNAVNETDLLVSMATFRYNHPEFVDAQIDSSTIITANEMAHPLLRGVRVTNDFKISSMYELCVITGANMAGKSTFLRSAGVNLVLANSGNVVCSADFRFTPITIFTSMRTTDNLAKGTSYFHAELLRLKALVDKSSQGKPMFIILDEMLKGTNSADKLNGSRRFLIKLLELDVCGIVATHDLQLGELSNHYPQNFRNLCFEIEHSGADIAYDYKLREGVSQNMNATILLESMQLI